MRLPDLFKRVPVISPELIPDIEVKRVVTDSRSVKSGDLFVAVRGLHSDGHDYIENAVANGAAAVAVDCGRVPENTGALPFIEVQNSLSASAYLHSAANGDPADSLRVIAVTGTNGKTSVTFILRSILKSAGYRVGLIGTVRILMPPDSDDPAAPDEEYDAGGGSELYDMPAAMTTPDPAVFYRVLAEMKRRGTDYVVIEATSHALDRRKLEPIKPIAAIFTNLTPEHLDYHGTMENYLAAKAKLFAMTPVAIANADDASLPAIEKAAPNCRFIRCTMYGEALGGRLPSNGIDTAAVNISFLGADGVEYMLVSRSSVMRIRCPIPGRYTVTNTMLAIRTALALGVDQSVIQDSVRVINGVDGRLERVKTDATKPCPAIFIDYAHTPAALENMLVTVREFTRGRLILLFGCGGDRDRAKRPVMGEIASRFADFSVITSDNCRTEDPFAIIDGIMSGFDRARPHIIIPDRAAAITAAVMLAGEDDVLILAGKGHEKYEIDAAGKHPFDESEKVRAAVRMK